MLLKAAILLVAGGWFANGAGSRGDESEPSSEPLILEPCRIELIDRAILASEQSGVLAEVPIEGTQVSTGQLVAQLRDAIPAAALAVAQAQAEMDVEIRAACKAEDVTKVEHQRALYANRRTAGTVSELEVRRLQLEHERAVLAIEQAEAQRKLHRLQRDEAEAVRDSYHLLAPLSGTVTRVMKVRGEAVRQGDPILEMVSINRVRVTGELPVKYRQQVRPSTYVEVEPLESGFGEQESPPRLAGQITFVDLVADPFGHVRVQAEVSNPDQQLIPGLSARLIIFPRRKVTPKAPQAASREVPPAAAGRSTAPVSTGDSPQPMAPRTPSPTRPSHP